MNQHTVGLKNSIINLNNAVDGLRDNYNPWQMDEVANAMERFVTEIGARNPRDAVTVAESIYLGALLCSVKRFEDVAKKFWAIREQYAKKLEPVKRKEVWE